MFENSVFHAPRHILSLNIITLCCLCLSMLPIALSAGPLPAIKSSEVKMCPEQVGGIFRALPNVPLMLTEPPQASDVTCVLRKSATRYILDNVANGVTGKVCACVRTSFDYLFDVIGRTKYIKKDVEYVPLDQAQCEVMIDSQISLAGKMEFNNVSHEWETHNEMPTHPAVWPLKLLYG